MSIQSPPEKSQEVQLMDALLSAHPQWGKGWVSLMMALRSRAVPRDVKLRYTAHMAQKYPGRTFGWEELKF